MDKNVDAKVKSPVDKNVDAKVKVEPPLSSKPPVTQPSTTTVEKRSAMTSNDENNPNTLVKPPQPYPQPAITPLGSRYKWTKGDMNFRRGDENSSAPPKFHPPPPSHSRPQPQVGTSPYPFFHPSQQHLGAYPQPQQSYPVPMSFPTPHQIQYPHQHQRQPQTPYMHSPTPTLSYSPYDPSMSMSQRSGFSAPKKRSTTPTPSSRAYRSFPSGSSRQSVTTPASVKTPFHSHQSTTPASAGGTSQTERILLPKPQSNGALPILSGIEPNATWPLHEGPPPLYLEGEDGKEVPTPENMNQSEAERWSKLSKDSNKFRSHNPWDYIAPDTRQQFSPSQRVVLESLWILTSTPCPKERERIAVWMGVYVSSFAAVVG